MLRDIIAEDCDQLIKLADKSNLDFNSLNGKTILITGGTGFFGKWLLTTFLHVNSLLSLNARCVVVTRNSALFLEKYPVFKNPALSFIDGDIRNFEVGDGKYDIIIHAATPASAALERDHPEEMKSIIEDGTRHIVEVARRCSTTKILFTSSGGAYGSSIDCHPFSESDECRPNTVYGKAKLAAENMLLNSGLNTVVARCFAFVGPFLDLDIHYAVGNFIKDTLEKRSIVIKGDGTPVRSYMYSLDLMFWLWTLLINGQKGTIYNVGSNRPVSILELANLIAGNGSQVIVAAQSNERGTSRSFYLPDTVKVENELKLQLSYTLEESITRTLHWNLQNV